VLAAARLCPDGNETTVTAVQVRDVVARLAKARHWREGDSAILAILDADDDVTRQVWLTCRPVQSDVQRPVMHLPAAPRQPDSYGSRKWLSRHRPRCLAFS
jgi:hypothetical protein